MKRFLVPIERPNECKRPARTCRVMKVKITKLENVVIMHACKFRWAKIPQEYYSIGLAHPKLLLPYTQWATMRDDGKKLPN
jgi:hypothetical protein